MKSPYQQLGGSEGIRQLASEFYQAMDELSATAEIRAMHADNLDEIKEKLFEYLSGWLGGPALYSQQYGTVCLTEPHSHYQITAAHRDQWLACMDKALERINASDEIKHMLKQPMFELADLVKNTA